MMNKESVSTITTTVPIRTRRVDMGAGAGKITVKRNMVAEDQKVRVKKPLEREERAVVRVGKPPAETESRGVIKPQETEEFIEEGLASPW